MKWHALLTQFLTGLVHRHYRPGTVDRYRYWLSRLSEFAQSQGLSVAEVTADGVDAYGHQLKLLGYSEESRMQALGMVRTFFRWALAEGVIVADPTGRLVLPRIRHPERVCPTPQAVVRLLDEPDPRSPDGLRDRAAMALMYGTGVRVFECEALDVEDVDLRQAALRVREGKDGAARLLPMGECLMADLEDWLRQGRPRYRRRSGERALFLTFLGERLSVQSLRKMVRRHGEAAGVGPVGPHLLRHAFGTHLLEAGADISQVQQLLGHKTLAATQTYTHVTLLDVVRTLDRTHPRHQPPSPP